MFTTLIVQPIFNLLVLIYALLPGHNFGLAIIIFTIVVRLLLWPLVKRQLHQTKKMRAIQPDLKRIQKQFKGDKQKLAAAQMELFKEKGINPIGSLGPVILQLPILIGLYSGLQKIIADPNNVINFSYPAIQNLPFMKDLAANIGKFDVSLFGIVDLTRPALGTSTYIPALIIVLASAVIQFMTSKQLLPVDKDARKLRDILKEAKTGQQADQMEVNAAVGRSTMFILPVFIVLVTVQLPSLLGLYWLVSGLVAYIQQSIVLREDATELQAIGKSEKDVTAIPEAEVVTGPIKKKKKPAAKKRKRK